MLVWLPVVPSVPVFFHIAFEMITGTLLLWHPGQCHEFSFRSSQEPIFALTFLAAFLEPPPGSLALVPVVSGNFWIWVARDHGHQHQGKQQKEKRNENFHCNCWCCCKWLEDGVEGSQLEAPDFLGRLRPLCLACGSAL